MDLALDDDQRLIVDSAVRLLSQAASPAATRAAAETADGIDRALWQQMAQLGWCGVHLPAAHGGLELGHASLALLQEQLGRHLACVPYFDSVAMAGTLLAELAPQAEGGAATTCADLLTRIATGDCIACWATEGSARAVLQNGRWVLQGAWPLVGSAASAGLLLLPAWCAAGDALLFAVEGGSPGLQITPLKTIDRTRRQAAVHAQGLHLGPEALLASGPACTQAQQRATALAAVALAAEQLGVAQQCLDLTVAHVKQRVQFGQPIGRFQAVKHRCAQMLVAVETARSAVYGAAAMADTQPGTATLQFHAAMARTLATQAAQFCSQEALQLHGGVGMTWDYEPHLYFKRAQASSQRLGPARAWCESVAAQLLDGAAA